MIIELGPLEVMPLQFHHSGWELGHFMCHIRPYTIPYMDMITFKGQLAFSPVISCLGKGTTEWQRFECLNMFIRVPRDTVPNFQKFPCKENMLQRFLV